MSDPFSPFPDYKDLTQEQILEKYNEVNQKMRLAHRAGANPHIIGQMQMLAARLLEHYHETALIERINEGDEDADTISIG
mgnify:FL=1|jgi:hypothetical protein|tara:strand:- start:7 stop:246 length:240 start_codon:yes stop_codon:yes gene_type:complete